MNLLSGALFVLASVAAKRMQHITDNDKRGEMLSDQRQPPPRAHPFWGNACEETRRSWVRSIKNDLVINHVYIIPLHNSSRNEGDRKRVIFLLWSSRFVRAARPAVWRVSAFSPIENCWAWFRSTRTHSENFIREQFQFHPGISPALAHRTTCRRFCRRDRIEDPITYKLIPR